MRLRVSPATACNVAQVAVSETEASLIEFDHFADGAVEFRDRSVDRLAPRRRGSLRRLPMQRHRIGDVEADDLRNRDAASDGLGRGVAVLAGERVERDLKHITAGGAAKARVEAERRFLLDRAPARFGIVPIELAAQQRAEMRQLQLFHQVAVGRDGFPDIRQRARDRDDFVDRAFEAGRDQRPGFDDGAAGAIVEAVERQTGFEGLDDCGWRHQRESGAEAGRRMLGDKPCATVNDSITTRDSYFKRVSLKVTGGRSLPLLCRSIG